MSKCPKKYDFVKKSNSSFTYLDSEVSRIALSVVQKCYLRMMSTNYKADWRAIIGWVDKLVFQDIDPLVDEEFKLGRLRSEAILIWMSKWYKEYYLNNNYEVWVDLKLSHDLDKFMIEDQIPIISLAGDFPTLTYISGEVVSGPLQLYNNIKLRTLLWLIERNLGSKKVCLEYFSITDRGGFKREEIFVDRESNKRTGRIVKQLGSMIMHKLDYPSVGEQCKTCTFYRRCKI